MNVLSDAEIVDIATGMREGILDGKDSRDYCFMVAAPLAGCLAALDCEARLVHGDIHHASQTYDHYWLELPDGRILDPTADQFTVPKRPMPTVYLGRRPTWYGEPKKPI